MEIKEELVRKICQYLNRDPEHYFSYAKLYEFCARPNYDGKDLTVALACLLISDQIECTSCYYRIKGDMWL